MAERVLINKQILQDSIDAIRAKKGTTDSIVVADMPTEIASIEGGGSGIADSTKTLVNAISGVTPTDETTLNNAIAKAYADTPSEQKWNGTRSTADGGTIKDGVAFVESIKGSTMKFNQLVKMDGVLHQCETSNGIIYTKGTGWQALSSSDKPFIKLTYGHIYLVCYVPINVESGDVYFYAFGKVFNTLSYSICTANSTSSNFDFIYTRSMPLGSTFKLRLIDLTECGLDSLTTADEVAQYYGYSTASEMPLDIYEPTTNLRNFTHNSISSKSRNLWDEQWEVGGYSPSTGAKSEAPRIRSKNYIAIRGGANYCVSFGTATGNDILFFYYDADKTFLSTSAWTGSGATITPPSNACYVNFHLAGSYGTTYNNDICLMNGSANLGYAPYESDTLSLNVPTSVFPNGMNGVGTAYDEWKPSEGKAIKRIGQLKLKDQNWRAYSGNFYFSLGVNANMKICFTTEKRMITRPYLVVGASPLSYSSYDKAMWYQTESPDHTIVARDTTYTDVASFKAHFTDDDILYYELATESETTTDKVKAFYKVANGGTESVSGGTDSAPIKADIGYRGMSAEELVTAINI